MVRRIVFIALLASLLLAASAIAADRSFRVTNVSIDHVYLNGGSRDSLKVGDVLLKVEGSQRTPFLKVVYTARHSASCILLDSTATVVVGETVILEEIRRSGPLIIESLLGPAVDSGRTQATSRSFEGVAKSSPSRLSGSVRFGFYTWQDNSPNNLDFSQSTARLNLKVERLWQRDLTLVVRSRGRYDARRRSLAGSVDRTEWRNRLWESSLTWRNEDRTRMIAVGRLLPRRIAGSGYLDGGLAEVSLSETVRLGALAGMRADWLYYDEHLPSVGRAGGYVTYRSVVAGQRKTEQTLGFVYERSEGQVNRSYLSLVGSLYGRRWSLSHSAEIDINTGWRKDLSGNSLALSNFYVNAGYRPVDRVRFSLTYDNRRDYLTFVTLSAADSVFNDRLRQGARVRLDWSARSYLHLDAGIGVRERREGQDRTYNFNFGIRRSSLADGRLSLSAVLAGFDGPYESGLNAELRSLFSTSSLGVFDAAVGEYRYSVDNSSISRSSRYVEIGNSFLPAKSVSLRSAVSVHSGDDIDGVRLRLELGYRY